MKSRALGGDGRREDGRCQGGLCAWGLRVIVDVFVIVVALECLMEVMFVRVRETQEGGRIREVFSIHLRER